MWNTGGAVLRQYCTISYTERDDVIFLRDRRETSGCALGVMLYSRVDISREARVSSEITHIKIFLGGPKHVRRY